MESIRVHYQTIEFGITDIHLRTLRDKQQYFDKDGVAEKLGISSATWPIFGVVWPSSVALANYLLQYDLTNKRILEVGCGIGLVSLLLNHHLADITATDIHPEAESFLLENVLLNKGSAIPFTRASWDSVDTGMGEFDLVVGSDLLYERKNIVSLAEFINRHAKSGKEVIIVDPGRGNHASFSKKMIKLGYAHEQYETISASNLEKSFNGKVIHYQS